MKNKLIVISIDSLMTSDLSAVSNLPNLGNIVNEGCVVKAMQTLYPTITYPVHATVMTGRFPKDHGVNQNFRFTTDKYGEYGYDWFFNRNDMKTDTLIDRANAKGMTTGCSIWPVMGGETPTYNAPEIWPISKETTPREAFMNASNKHQTELFFDAYYPQCHHLSKQEMLDQVGTNSAIDMIVDYDVDLLMWHIIGLDSARHKHGVFNEGVDKALIEADRKVGLMVEKVNEAGLAERVSYLIFGDHSHIDIEREFLLNQILRNKGYIQEEGGRISDYQIYSFMDGFSSKIYLKNIKKEKAHSILREIQDEYYYCIDQIFTEEESLDRFGLKGDFSFIVEGTRGTNFSNVIDHDRKAVETDKSRFSYKATHGHLPYKGDTTLLIGSGPAFLRKETRNECHVIDIAATIDHMFSLGMKELDGKVLDILK